ncbi:cupin [Paenibacillus sp. CAU 1782]
MKIFDFGKETGKEIANFNSKHAAFSRVVKHEKQVHIGCIHVGADGVVGSHPATIHQLFLVVSGQGWVIGKEGVKYDIQPGMAAYWEPEEMHESGSEQGMTAIIIEGEDLIPAMSEIEWLKSDK